MTLKLGINYVAGGGPNRDDHRNCSDSWDFGPVPHRWQTYWRSHLRADIAEMYAAGFRALRWFLLGSGKSFGINLESPTLNDQFANFIQRPESRHRLGAVDSRRRFLLEALRDSTNWEFSIPGTVTCNEIVADFLEALRIFKQFNDENHFSGDQMFRLMPVIIDYRLLNAHLLFEHFGGILGASPEKITRGNNLAQNIFGDLGTPIRSHLSEFTTLALQTTMDLIPGCRQKPFLTISGRREFRERFLEPLLSGVTMGGVSNQILAWDIGNELDILIPPEQPWPTPDKRWVLDFVNETTELIRNSLYTTTVGWLWENTLRKLDRVVGYRPEDWFQYHAYAHANGVHYQPIGVGTWAPRPDGSNPIHTTFLGDHGLRWWPVPDASTFRRPSIIGELPTAVVNPEEMWVAPFHQSVGASPPTSNVNIPLFRFNELGAPVGNFRFGESMDGLPKRLNLIRDRHYDWVFLWTWNRAGDPYAAEWTSMREGIQEYLHPPGIVP